MKTRTRLAAVGLAAAILTVGCVPYHAHVAIPGDLYSYDAAYTGYEDPGAVYVYSRRHHGHAWCHGGIHGYHGHPGHCGHMHRYEVEGRDLTDHVHGGGGQ